MSDQSRTSIITESRNQFRSLFYGKNNDRHSTLNKQRMFGVMIEMLDSVKSLPSDLREDLLRNITSDESQYLSSIVLSMASSVANGGPADHFQYGVRALVIEGASFDWRESVISYALLQHSAQQVNLDIDSVLHEEEALANETMRKLLHANRISSKVNLADYGWTCVFENGNLSYRPIR